MKIMERPKELNSFLKEYGFFSDEKKAKPKSAETNNTTVEEIIEKLKTDKNWDKINKLMQGEFDEYPSHNEADLALCGYISKYTSNPVIINKVFETSGLHRGKWNEKRGAQTYGEMTIDKVLSSIDDSHKDFIRVGDDYFKKIISKNQYGFTTVELSKRSRTTLIDDFGKEFLKKVQKLDGFTVEPCHVNFKEYIGNKYNLYHPIPHTPCEGSIETIMLLMQHIFGDQLEYALDYLQLLYLNPKQKLPVIALVSSLKGTGKTTFLLLLHAIFGENVTIISTREFNSDFNSVYASKLIICIEEGQLTKDDQIEKIKNLSMAKTIPLRLMRRDYEQIPFNGHFVIASNFEKTVLKIDSNDNRYWIFKVPQVKKFDPDFEKKLHTEIPAFLHFLSNRKLVAEQKSRMFFDPEIINNSMLDVVRLESMSDTAKELILGLIDFMEEKCKDLFHATLSDLKTLLFDRNSRINRPEIKRALTEELEVKPVSKQRYTNYLNVSTTGNYYEFDIENLKKLTC